MGNVITTTIVLLLRHNIIIVIAKEAIPKIVTTTKKLIHYKLKNKALLRKRIKIKVLKQQQGVLVTRTLSRPVYKHLVLLLKIVNAAIKTEIKIKVKVNNNHHLQQVEN